MFVDLLIVHFTHVLISRSSGEKPDIIESFIPRDFACTNIAILNSAQRVDISPYIEFYICLLDYSSLLGYGISNVDHSKTSPLLLRGTIANIIKCG